MATHDSDCWADEGETCTCGPSKEELVELLQEKDAALSELRAELRWVNARQAELVEALAWIDSIFNDGPAISFEGKDIVLGVDEDDCTSETHDGTPEGRADALVRLMKRATKGGG